MHHFELKISKNIAQYQLLNNNDKVIVALSGGADSVALLVALVDLGYDCVAAHCNFHLRGEESDRDEIYATTLASKLNVEFRVIHFDVASYEKKHKVSTEMACRELRYEWFEQLRQEYSAQSIAVAHHRDDDIETLFLNLLRGSGINGIAAMKWKNGNIVRPMLDIPRVAIEEYLKSLSIDYVVDSTNLENDFKRNRLRNEILPSIEAAFPGANELMARSLGFLKENRVIYQQAIEEAKKQYFQDNKIQLNKLLSEYVAPTTLLYEILSPLGFNSSQVEDIIQVAGDTGRQFFSQYWVAIINRGTIELIEASEYEDKDEYILDLSFIFENIVPGQSQVVDNGPIKLEVKVVDVEEFSPTIDSSEILFDLDLIKTNPQLLLRHWKTGDRIAPFGMNGSKKVSDIFSDAKLSLAQKNRTWIMELDGIILWILGLRASKHFAVNKNTTQVLCIKYLD